MDVGERTAGDRDRLDELIRATSKARQRDRYRMVRLALDGEEKLRIAHLLGVAKSTVETWVSRDGGLDALVPIKQPGAARKLDPSHDERLRARLDAGATEADGVCTLRGRDVRRIRVYFADEARFGQQGTLTKVWARTGSRPTAVRQTGYEWVYLYGAVEPATEDSVALLAPQVNIGTMEVFLRMLGKDVAATGNPDDVALVIMDQAGWHVSKRLKVPSNVRLIFLPPYSPELAPHWTLRWSGCGRTCVSIT